MKLNLFKTLNYDSFSNEAKKCLSPASKKILLYYINSNVNSIKSALEKFNKKYSSEKNKNSEIIETNSRFRKYMDKYYEYKKYFKEKDKHKLKKKSKSTIDLVIDNYLKKGYKIPNLEKNIFHENPLNDKGKMLQKYFNEYIRDNKKLVSSQEKNLFYLNKIGDCVLNQKFKEKKNLQMILNSSNNNNKNNLENNKINTNHSNIFLKKYFKNIKKPCLSENDSLENNEDFLQLNEYEQKNIKQLIKNNEENKKYKTFIEKILSDKKYFDTIDNDNIELDKKTESKLKYLNPIQVKESNKRLLQLKIDNDNNKKVINDNSEDSSNISENDDFSSEKSKEKEKEKEKKIKPMKKSLIKLYYNDKLSNNYKFNFPQKKNNFITINKKHISEKDLKIFAEKNKKLPFLPSKEEIEDSFNIKLKRDNKTKKTYILRGNNFLKKFNYSLGKASNKSLSKLSKEKSLNFLFNKISKGKNLDKKTLSEYKKYFMINKNMSENDLNEFINRDYEPKDFYNLVNSVNMKIQSANIEKKWRKNYLKIGRLQERKNILEEEKKQDNFISHLLQYFILAKSGKIKLYQFQ